MRAIGLVSSDIRQALRGAFVLMLSAIAGCSAVTPKVSVRSLPIQQSWEHQPGDEIAGHRVAGSLGDVSIELKGANIYAPFNGEVQPNDIEGCVLYSSPEVPAYMFRFCGVNGPKLGVVKQGDAIGRADYLQFAALRRQPDGTWALVEPAQDILQRTLQR
jgi:hypothetical protein